MNREDRIYYTKQIAMIVGIIAFGLLAFNQFIEWKYNAQFLMGPCETCISLNPEWKQCYNIMSKPKPSPVNYVPLNLSNFSF